MNGSTLASSGFALTSAGTRSRTYITCVYIGCSTHSVPSWSKVAIRSAGGTNFGLPCVVVVCTNSTIAFLAGPSFHEGSGSVCASACAPKASAAPSASMRANMKDKVGFKERMLGFLAGAWASAGDTANSAALSAASHFVTCLRALHGTTLSLAKAGKIQLRSLSFQYFDPAAATPAWSPFLVSV